MGEIVSATKVTFVCGLWSVGAVVLLSAGPFSYFCIHHLLFPFLEVLVQSASPHHAVHCKVLPGFSVDVKCFHVSLADILVAQLWAAFGSPSRCQLSIENVFWDAAILHAIDMSQPTQFRCLALRLYFFSRVKDEENSEQRQGKMGTISQLHYDSHKNGMFRWQCWEPLSRTSVWEIETTCSPCPTPRPLGVIVLVKLVHM